MLATKPQVRGRCECGPHRRIVQLLSPKYHIDNTIQRNLSLNRFNARVNLGEDGGVMNRLAAIVCVHAVYRCGIDCTF